MVERHAEFLLETAPQRTQGHATLLSQGGVVRRGNRRRFERGQHGGQPRLGLRPGVAPPGEVEQEALETIRRALRRKWPGGVDQANNFIHGRRAVTGLPGWTGLGPRERKVPRSCQSSRTGPARRHVTMVPGAALVDVKADVRTGIAGPKSRGAHDLPHIVVKELNRAAADELQRLVPVEEFIDPGRAARQAPPRAERSC